MIQSFYGKPAVRIPDYIILDMPALVQKAVEGLYQVPDFCTDHDTVFEYVFGFLRREDEALLELSYGVVELMHELDWGIEISDDEIIEVSDAVKIVGEHFYHQFKHLKLYQRGQLEFAFHRWLGDDLVLVNVKMPINQEKHLTRLLGVGKWP